MNEEAQQNRTVEAKKPSFLQSVFAAVKKYVNTDKEKTPDYLKEAKKYIKADENGETDIASIREKEYKEKRKTEFLKEELQASPTGRQCLKTIEESGYQICYAHIKTPFQMFGASAYCYGIPSAIDPEKKRIILNSKAGTDHHLLSLINAACTIKQEKNGVGNSPEIMAIRKADSIVTQMRYIEEGQEHIRDTFWRYRNANMNSVYHVATDVENVRYDYESEEYVSKSKKDRAYSACVDFFLDDVLGEKVPSAETIANVCRGFNGESYYNSDNWFSRDGKKEMDSARNAEHWKRYYKHTPNVYLEKEAFEYEERTKAVNKVLSAWEGNKSHKARLAEQKERLIQQKAIQLAKMKQGGR